MAVGKRSGEKALQKVLGQGANVNAANPLEVHDPARMVNRGSRKKV
ncbi:hypothetical protein ES703_46342 [subsurface metagenome]